MVEVAETIVEEVGKGLPANINQWVTAFLTLLGSILGVIKLFKKNKITPNEGE